eukprot:scaffold124786_cov61-Phaeocystis_antarctica.AAC.4
MPEGADSRTHLDFVRGRVRAALLKWEEPDPGSARGRFNSASRDRGVAPEFGPTIRAWSASSSARC